MKKIFTLLFAIVISTNTSFCQISSLPYTEGFENPFVQGTSVDFVPNFNGNIVASTNRIFQDASIHYSGAAACAVVPTSSFDGYILIHLNLTGYTNVFFSFWACSALNGGGTRPAIVDISTSIDNGQNFSPSVLIGDSVVFANSNTPWNNYQYYLPYFANSNSDVLVRIKVSRGDGTGTTARWLFDEATFDFSATDVTPPYVLDAYATALDKVRIAYSEPVNSTANNTANYTGIGNLGTTTNSTFNDTITIDLTSPLVEGRWYNFTVSNIQDASGNPMSSSQEFVVAFNDNTGNVKMTEINYDNPGVDSLSFVELRNLDLQPLNVGGWKFSKGLSGFFPSELLLYPGEYIVFSQYPSAVNSFFNISSYQISGSLNNSGENISIVNSEDALIDSVSYSILAPWDSMANGYGPSLVLCDESFDNDIGSNWTAATTFAGMFLGFDSIFANPMNNCTFTAGNNLNLFKETITAYPIPFNNDITIKCNSERSQTTGYEITDLTGRVLFHKEFKFVAGVNFIHINSSDLVSGIYILRIGSTSIKVFKAG